MKTFFQLKDNVLDKKLSIVIDSQTFTNRKQITSKVSEIIRFYAEHFTNNKLETAKQTLENHNYEVRRKDSLLISFFCGTITIITFMFIVLLSIPDTALDKKSPGNKNSTVAELFYSMPTFRFLFMIIYTVAAAGVVVSILKQYRINYMFIFELDP